MTTDEFNALQVGDKVKYLNTILHVSIIETETDFSRWNAITGDGTVRTTTWKVHYSNGQNNEITDSIVKYLKKL